MVVEPLNKILGLERASQTKIFLNGHHRACLMEVINKQ